MSNSVSTVFAGGNAPLSLIQTTSFPSITRPKRGNWYVLRGLEESAIDYKTVETDFIAQYITPSKPPYKILFLTVVTDYTTTARSTIFARISQIFQSAHTNNYPLILRHYYKDNEPSDFSIVEQDVIQFTAFLKDMTALYPDVLYVWQAGWLGNGYGEWALSPTTPDDDKGKDVSISKKKSFIVTQMLKLGGGIPISIRSPRDIANYFHGIGIV